MTRPGWQTVVVFTLAAALGGCARAGHRFEKEETETRLTKQWIAVLNSITAEYDGVTDKASMTKHRPAIEALSGELSKISQEFQTLPIDKKEMAMNTHGDELEQAVARMRAAKEKAIQHSMPKKSSR